MSLTKREQEIDVRRLIFGIYACSFSPPRVQKLCDALTNLDQLDACRLANEIDTVIGAAASEKLLKTISSHSHNAASESRSPQKRSSEKQGYENTNKLPRANCGR